MCCLIIYIFLQCVNRYTYEFVCQLPFKIYHIADHANQTMINQLGLAMTVINGRLIDKKIHDGDNTD